VFLRLFFASYLSLTDIIPFSVWCWGWDGAGDLEGPDVDPIWEKMPNRSYAADAVLVRHNRDIPLF
jgi:alpha-1,3-mannosyltransferase